MCAGRWKSSGFNKCAVRSSSKAHAYCCTPTCSIQRISGQNKIGPIVMCPMTRTSTPRPNREGKSMRAVFLDRDGVISENRNDHVKSWEEFRFLPGALDAL